jgi:D-threo-aldose 1-dehydrogenase
MELRFAREGDFDCFLLAGRYTLLDQGALETFLPYCQENHISVIAGAPFNNGILASDLREGAIYNLQVAPPAILEKARRIGAVCSRHGVPLKAAALQFILAHPVIASVIPGARTPKEVEENSEMVRFHIPRELWDELKGEGLIPEKAYTPS